MENNNETRQVAEASRSNAQLVECTRKRRQCAEKGQGRRLAAPREQTAAGRAAVQVINHGSGTRAARNSGPRRVQGGPAVVWSTIFKARRQECQNQIEASWQFKKAAEAHPGSPIPLAGVLGAAASARVSNLGGLQRDAQPQGKRLCSARVAGQQRAAPEVPKDD